MGNKAGQKRKKAENSKKHFKKSKTGPGHHLPKGTNVTRAEVKVAKIVIPKQIESIQSDSVSGVKVVAVTKRKLTLLDLINKLKNFSQSVKLEALDGLKELLTGRFGGNLIQDHLGLLINNLIPLCADNERKLRKACLEILQALLSNVKCDKLEPLYPLLSAHLSCCLTNIQPSIQRDALPLLDTLVLTAPAFISANFARILPDCLLQISSNTASAANKKSLSVGLSSQLTDKISSLQWRTDVLTRVNNILGCVCAHKTKSTLQHSNITCVQFNEAGLFAGLYNDDKEAKHLSKSDLFKKDSKDPFVDITNRILPLIIDSWIEATGKDDKKTDARTSFLTNEVYALFCSITGILDKLMVYCEMFDDSHIIETIKSTYLNKLESRLFLNLPYSSNNGKCEKENLELCHLILSIYNFDHISDPMFKKVVNILESCKTQGSEELRVFKQIIDKAVVKQDLSERNKVVLKHLVQRSVSYKVGSESWTQCIKLLGKQAETIQIDFITSWVSSLPEQLVATKLSDQSSVLLQVILNLSQTNNAALIEAYNEKYQIIKDWASEVCTESETSKLISFIHKNLNEN